MVYFELNDWTCPEEYDNLACFNEDEPPLLLTEEYVKDNELAVWFDVYDMSLNYCVTAKDEWVKKNYPNLLSKHKKLLRPDTEGDFRNDIFLPWSEENIGVHDIRGKWTHEDFDNLKN